uniref:Uncharacterized protein n=1 Tax=Rattus norvegicus TaxID=10116 RepID=A0A8I6A969_RAT
MFFLFWTFPGLELDKLALLSFESSSSIHPRACASTPAFQRSHNPGDAAQQEAKQREAEMRNSILTRVLDQSAWVRLSDLALVKPDKTKAVEHRVQMARYGQLSGTVSEQGFIETPEKVSQQTEEKATVKFNRREVTDSDEDDDY